MKNFIHIALWLCTTISFVQAQEIKFPTSNISIDLDSVVVQTEILTSTPSGKRLHTLTKTYHSFSEGQLHSTTGKHVGQLLHGPIRKFDARSNNLITEGAHWLGLKDGLWQYWKDGNLIKIEAWRQGYEEGTWSKFDEQGRLLCTRRYRNGLLDGPATSYLNGEPYWQCSYRKGLLIEEVLVGKPTEKNIPLLPHEL